MPQKWLEQKHRDLIACLGDGLSRRQAAIRVGVSAATAVRWARAAGLSCKAPARLPPDIRAALVAALEAGAKPIEAAARFQVSHSAVARLATPRRAARERAREALYAALSAGMSRRGAAAALGLSVATAIRWARDLDPACIAPASPSPRRPQLRRFRADREAKRAELMAAIDSGLSKRKAAAEVGLPVATAIRWASATRPRLT